MNDDIPAHVMDQILDRIYAGEKIAAIKIYKDYRGVKLVDAKQFIERLMDELENRPQAEVGATDVDITAELHQLIYQGRKLEAIKCYRQAHGSSLMDAKQQVEQLTEQLRLQDPGKFEKKSSSGCAATFLLICGGAMGTFAAVVLA